MKLLITTQAVDLDDQALGFFHRWIEELSKKFDSIEVICLKSGRFSLPPNVRVHTLGKEAGRSRFKYLRNFYRHIFALRGDYDAVFVHMNEEYVLLGGLFWRAWGKKVVLWRNHKVGSLFTRIAALIADTVCYTSSASYVAGFRNAAQMPIGIDTERFKPGAMEPSKSSILFLGRIDPVKNPLVFLDALERLREDSIDFHADIYGAPTYADDPQFAAFKERAKFLQEMNLLSLNGPVPNDQTPAIYAAHAMYVNLTPSGSFDKTIGEAVACGCIPIVANDALRGVIPEQLFVVDAQSAPDTVGAIVYALSLDDRERAILREKLRAYIEREHSLALLVGKLSGLLV